MARLTVRLTPRAGRDRIDGWARDGAGRVYLKVRVAATPVDGAANAALVRLLAKALGRPPSAVQVVSGDKARLKQVGIDGVNEAEISDAFGAAP